MVAGERPALAFRTAAWLLWPPPSATGETTWLPQTQSQRRSCPSQASPVPHVRSRLRISRAPQQDWEVSGACGGGRTDRLAGCSGFYKPAFTNQALAGGLETSSSARLFGDWRRGKRKGNAGPLPMPCSRDSQT